MKKTITGVKAYQNQPLFGGWTRIDILLNLYDRAIESLTAAKVAMENDDQTTYAKQFIQGQKAILAIHAGLKPDEHEVAFNVARLLHFVLTCLVAKKFDDAIKVLTNLRSGFAAIEEEATALENSGKIPAMPNEDQYRAVV